MSVIIELSRKKNELMKNRMQSIVGNQKNLTSANKRTIQIVMEKFKKAKEAFEDQVDMLDQSYKSQCDLMREQIEAQNRGIEEFKKHVLDEYVGFFKNKKKIKSDITETLVFVERKVGEFNSVIQKDKEHIEILLKSVSALIEAVGLTQNVVKQDILERESFS